MTLGQCASSSESSRKRPVFAGQTAEEKPWKGMKKERLMNNHTMTNKLHRRKEALPFTRGSSFFFFFLADFCVGCLTINSSVRWMEDIRKAFSFFPPFGKIAFGINWFIIDGRVDQVHRNGGLIINTKSNYGKFHGVLFEKLLVHGVKIQSPESHMFLRVNHRLIVETRRQPSRNDNLP